MTDTLSKSLLSNVDGYRLKRLIDNTNNVTFSHLMLYGNKLFSNNSRKHRKKAISSRIFSLDVWLKMFRKFLNDTQQTPGNIIFDEIISILSFNDIYEHDSIDSTIYGINDQLVSFFEMYGNLITSDNLARLLVNGIPVQVRVINEFIDNSGCIIDKVMFDYYIDNVNIYILNIHTFEFMYKMAYNEDLCSGTLKDIINKHTPDKTYLKDILVKLFKKAQKTKYNPIEIIDIIGRVIESVIDITNEKLTEDIFNVYNEGITLYIKNNKYSYPSLGVSYDVSYLNSIIKKNSYVFKTDDLKKILDLDKTINVDDTVKYLLSRFKSIKIDKECVDLCCKRKRIILIPIFLEHNVGMDENNMLEILQYSENNEINKYYLSENKLYLKNCIISYAKYGGKLTQAVFEKCLENHELLETIISQGYTSSTDEILQVVELTKNTDTLKYLISHYSLFNDTEFVDNLYKKEYLNAISIVIENKVYPTLEQFYILLKISNNVELILNIKHNGNITYDDTCLSIACSKNNNSSVITDILNNGITISDTDIEALIQTTENTNVITRILSENNYPITLQNLKDLNKNNPNISRKKLGELIDRTF